LLQFDDNALTPIVAKMHALNAFLVCAAIPAFWLLVSQLQGARKKKDYPWL